MRIFEFRPETTPAETQALIRAPVSTEATLESWLHANPHTILDEALLIFGRQYSLDTGRPDLLALDQWGNVLVIELKKGASGSGSASEETILSQPQNYAQSISRYEYDDLNAVYSEYKAALKEGRWEGSDATVIASSLEAAYRSMFDKRLDRAQVNGHQRIVILAEDVTSRTESNARYLLEQGLAVQCVEVQRFIDAKDGSDQPNKSILTSTTVVDYPLSRVRPTRSTADFSQFTSAIRDRIVTHVEQRDGIEEVRSTPTQVKVTAMHPPGLRYEVYLPGNQAGRETELRINASAIADDHVEGVRAILKQHDESQTSYAVQDEGVMAIIHRTLPITIERRNEAALEEITDEIVGLIQRYQPALAAEFTSSD